MGSTDESALELCDRECLQNFGLWKACSLELQVGLQLTSSLLLEYSSEYLNEYSSTR